MSRCSAKAFSVGLLTLIASVLGRGQDLTLDQALALAKRASPRLQSLEAAVKAKQAAAEQANVGLNPTIGVVAGNREQMLELGQELEFPGKRLARTRTALAESEIAARDWEAAALDMEREVAVLFYDVLWARANESLLRENLALAESSLASAQAKSEQGTGSALDVIKGRVEVARTRRMLESAAQELASGESRLRILLKMKPGPPLGLRGDLRTPLEIPAAEGPAAGLEFLTDLAIRSHPAVLVERSRRKAAESRVDVARLSARPNFDLGFAGGVDDKEARVSLSLSIPLSLWDKKKGVLAEAVSARTGANFDIESAILSVSQGVTSAFHTRLAAERSVRLFEGTLLDEARGAAELARKAYDAGGYRFLDLIDAQRTSLDANQEYLANLLVLRRAEIDLRVATGKSLGGGRS